VVDSFLCDRRYPDSAANHIGKLRRKIAVAIGKTGARIALAGSYRPEPDADAVGEINPDAPLAVTLHFKRRSADPVPGSKADLARLMKPITREALDQERVRTHSRAAARIVKFAAANGLAVRDVDLTSRRVVLEAPARHIADVFGTTLRLYHDGERQFRARSGSLEVPRAIAPWTRAVLGFDERPQVRPLNGNADGNGLWPTEIAALYGIPLDRDVSSQCVGIVALGGGYLPADLSAALAAMGRHDRTVVEQSVGGAVNRFGGGTPADKEIALDLQIIAGLLPAARIVVYFAGNNTRLLADAVHQAVLDEVNRPQVLSISWGSAETYWNDGGRDAVQAALSDAVRRQISVVVAAGDELAGSGVPDGKAHVWFPASSPYVLGCGGTAVALAGGAIANESVWKDGVAGTGGGVSDAYPIPDFQTGIALPASVSTGKAGRGVPDVAALAARSPGYRTVLNGQPVPQSGTSAGTPLWAALIAIANAQRSAPIGLVNPYLYAAPDVLRPITVGDNKSNNIGYVAGDGWSACTGLGVPKGADVIAALGAPLVA
jgi:kumamolisin